MFYKKSKLIINRIQYNTKKERMKKQLLLLISMSNLLINGMEKPNPQKKHIVYSPYYDITFFGIEKVHPFDSAKYSKIAANLVAKKLLTYNDFHTPREITDAELERVHSTQYIKNLHNCASAMFAQASGVMPIALIPNWIIRWKGLYPMRLATGGTVEATKLAIKNGWAINLSGGYHHAKQDDCYSGGFCIYNDAAVAAHIAITDHQINKILVIDLDAHQGNGNEAIFGKHAKFTNIVDVFDIYGSNIYPNVTAERNLMIDQTTWYNHPIHTSKANDNNYLLLLQNLSHAITTTAPQLIIYNAGTDIYETDPLGCMHVTKQGIIERDAYVFNLAKKKSIPIIMMLSGGYTTESAGIISDSIENIMTKIMNGKK